uniref:Uncharacterized protein n=1 Tax=Arundo donax TaxID=35708 RepID=A0A0A8YTX4_ARUDO
MGLFHERYIIYYMQLISLCRDFVSFSICFA